MEKGDAGPGRKERDCTPRCVQGVCLLKGINLRICTGCPVKLASLKRYYLARFRDTILIVFCNQPDPQTSQPTRSSLHSSSASFFQPLVFPPRRHPFSLSFCLFLSSLFSLSFSRPLSSSSCFWDLENSGELAPLHDFIAFLSHFKCPFQLSFFFLLQTVAKTFLALSHLPFPPARSTTFSRRWIFDRLVNFDHLFRRPSIIAKRSYCIGLFALESAYSWRYLETGGAKRSGKSADGEERETMVDFTCIFFLPFYSFLFSRLAGKPFLSRARTLLICKDTAPTHTVPRSLARQNLTKQFAPKQTTASGLLVNKQHIYFQRPHGCNSFARPLARASRLFAGITRLNGRG